MSEAQRTPRTALRNARRLRGLTLASMAERLKVTPAAVSSWECGTRTPSDPMIPAIARALRIQPADVLRMIDGPAA